MLCFDRIYGSDGIDTNKASASKECESHWYFLCYGFNFQPNVCKRCHDSLMMSMNLSSIAILDIKCSDYLYIISRNSKS